MMRGHIASMVFLPKTHEARLTVRDTSDKSQQRDSLQNPHPTFLRTAKVTPTRSVWDVTAQGSLRRRED